MALHCSHGQGSGTIKRGGKKVPLSPSQAAEGGEEPVPRAIVVYPASLSPPLVDIPPRRSRILIPRCRFGILHTCIYCTLDTSSRNTNMHSIAIPLRPRCRVLGSGGVGLLLVEPAYENTGPEYSTERKCSRPLLNADKDIETAPGNRQGFGVSTSVNYTRAVVIQSSPQIS